MGRSGPSRDRCSTAGFSSYVLNMFDLSGQWMTAGRSTGWSGQLKVMIHLPPTQVFFLVLLLDVGRTTEGPVFFLVDLCSLGHLTLLAKTLCFPVLRSAIHICCCWHSTSCTEPIRFDIVPRTGPLCLLLVVLLLLCCNSRYLLFGDQQVWYSLSTTGVLTKVLCRIWKGT